MRTRFFCLMMALALLFLIPLSAGTLSFSQGLTEWSQALEAGRSLGVTAQFELTAWPNLTPQTVNAIQTWLAGHQLSLVVKGQDSLAQLLAGDQALLSMQAGQDTESAALTLFTPDEQPPARYLGDLMQPPWQVLLGQDTWLPDLNAFQTALTNLGQAALPHLAAFEKPVKTSTSIKNVGIGKSQLVYTLKKDEAQAFWQAVSADLLPLMDAAVFAVTNKQAKALTESLRTMKPEGTLIIKRILDADGQDLGLQVTGTVAVDGKTRKLTLFGGVVDKGLYISFKLPSTRGSDTFTAQISFTADKGKLAGDWRVLIVAGKHRRNLTGKLNLKSLVDESGERISGKFSLSDRITGDVKSTLEYVITPDIHFTGNTLQGSLLLQEMSGKTARKEIRLALTGALDAPFAALVPMTEMDLRTAAPGQVSAAAEKVKTAFLPLITEFLMAQPLETRRLILHDLGRDARTQGESVPVTNADHNPFTVIDDHKPDDNNNH
ncbi:MAG: hypothetical protein GXZ04_06815 [Clostridiales bacterium]|nr:hypothetical protein [Clostridiales bacterium]